MAAVVSLTQMRANRASLRAAADDCGQRAANTKERQNNRQHWRQIASCTLRVPVLDNSPIAGWWLLAGETAAHS
jgi:hypothetical protein